MLWKNDYRNNAVSISEMISSIISAKTIEELRLSVKTFLRFSKIHPNLKKHMHEQFIVSIKEFGEPYFYPPMPKNNRVVLIPVDLAPVLLMPTCFSLTDSDDSFFLGLRRFSKKLKEYIDPIEDIITENEMNLVLDVAQKQFRALDIIARKNPLKIFILENSHIKYNCECGITTSQEAMVFVYHPREKTPVLNRVFIFAHELGHALHLSLTGDLSIVPMGFNEFNKKFNIHFRTIGEIQEAFADVFAFAIFSNIKLKSYLSNEIPHVLLNRCKKYVDATTTAFFNSSR